MQWPSGIESGQTSHHPVSALDFLPTFCDLAQAKIPEDLELDGTNFLPALKNLPVQRDKPLIWAYYNAINEHRVAMRSDRWKVLAKVDIPKMQNLHSNNIEQVRAAQLSDIQIFDLKNDIAEVSDLSGKHGNLKNVLTDELTRAYNDLLDGSHIWEPVQNP